MQKQIKKAGYEELIQTAKDFQIFLDSTLMTEKEKELATNFIKSLLCYISKTSEYGIKAYNNQLIHSAWRDLFK